MLFGYLGFLIILAVKATLILIAGSLSETFRVDKWGTAFTAAAAMMFISWAFTAFIQLFAGDTPDAVPLVFLTPWVWQGVLFSLVFNAVTLAICAAILPGILLRNVFPLLIAATLVTAVDTAVPFVVPALTKALLSS